MTDWGDEEPATIEAKLLLPKWVRWLAEKAELPGDLVEQLLTQVEPK
jgi:hypothetical protein